MLRHHGARGMCCGPFQEEPRANSTLGSVWVPAAVGEERRSAALLTCDLPPGRTSAFLASSLVGVACEPPLPWPARPCGVTGAAAPPPGCASSAKAWVEVQLELQEVEFVGRQGVVEGLGKSPERAGRILRFEGLHLLGHCLCRGPQRCRAPACPSRPWP